MEGWTGHIDGLVAAFPIFRFYVFIYFRICDWFKCFSCSPECSDKCNKVECL